MSTTDKNFAGSIPEIYDRLLVPLIFQTYARDLAELIARERPGEVLETAAGTGVLTQAIVSRLPTQTRIFSTDLNQPMLDHAGTKPISRDRVTWQQADALALPFEHERFDVVTCQFGVMFFPDKAKAFAEARRVLKPGGVFIFNAWDRIEENEFADVVTTAVAALFPPDPPRFLARTPHGYHDLDTIRRDLANGGFAAAPRIDTVTARSRAASPRMPAVAYCQGTPLRNEIEARNASRLGEATEIAADAVARRFGRDAVDGKIQAHIVTVER